MSSYSWNRACGCPSLSCALLPFTPSWHAAGPTTPKRDPLSLSSSVNSSRTVWHHGCRLLWENLHDKPKILLVFGSEVYKMEQEQAVEGQRNRTRLSRMASCDAPPKVPFSFIVSFLVLFGVQNRRLLPQYLVAYAVSFLIGQQSICVLYAFFRNQTEVGTSECSNSI